MAKTGLNGWAKIVIGVLVTLLLASSAWIWNAASITVGMGKDVQANTKICNTIPPKVDSNTIAITSIGKDIERLDEKVVELNVSQKEMLSLQRQILVRLPRESP